MPDPDLMAELDAAGDGCPRCGDECGWAGAGDPGEGEPVINAMADRPTRTRVGLYLPYTPEQRALRDAGLLVRIGRPGPWGNPWRIGPDGKRHPDWREEWAPAGFIGA